MAARLTRGKRKIVTAGIPFGVPDASALPERLDAVAQVAYLAFTAGYAPGSGPDLLRADLSGEAVRLVRVTLALRPDEPVLRGAARAAAPPALPPRRPRRRRRAARAAARPGPLPVAPRRGRRGARPARAGCRPRVTSPLAESYRLQALRGGRARDGGHGIRHPVGPDLRALRGTGGAQPVTGRAAGRGRGAGRAGRARGRGWRPSTSWTARCRTATGCPRCAASCSPGRVSAPPPSRPSTWRSPGAATTSSASTSPAAAPSWRHPGQIDQ